VSQADHPLADLYARPLGPIVPGPARPALGSDYDSPSGRAQWTRWLLGLAVAANMGSLLVLGLQRSMLDRGFGGFTLAEWESSRAHVNDMASVDLLVAIGTGIVFLCWLHLCYRNLRALAVDDPPYTPGWAVGSWFIPVLNLFRPYQVVAGLWRTTAVPGTEGDDWRRRPASGLVAVWWLTFLAGGALSQFASVGGTSTFADVKREGAILFVSHLLYVASAALAFRLVGALSQREDALASRLADSA